MFGRRKRALKWVALVAIAATTVLAWLAWQYGPTAALMLDLSGTTSVLRPWLPARLVSVTSEDVQVPSRHGAIAARVYRPSQVTTHSLLVVPGIHAGDLDEPRLARFSRRLAESGTIVMTLPLPDLRRYRVTSASTDAIEDAAAWMAREPRLAPAGRLGLVGISFSGGLALVAAGRPALTGKVSFVVSLGGHGDLPRVMAYLAGVVAPIAGQPPPHDYGMSVIALAAIPRLVPPEQVLAAEAAVTTFLDASSLDSTDKPRSVQLFATARELGDRLPEPSRTLVHLVNTRDVRSLGMQVAPWLEALGGAAALSPARSPATTTPVFLLHGKDDTVIPSSEAPLVAAYLAQNGNSHVRTLLTPLVSHADTRPDAPWMDVWRLVRFWKSIGDAF